jgi:hypothetical protein
MELIPGNYVRYQTHAADYRHMNQSAKPMPHDRYPAKIIAVHDDETLDLKVTLYGHGEFEKQAVKKGDGPGEWSQNLGS